MTKKDVIEKITAVKGVGLAKAEALYEHGFNSVEKLQKASVEDLMAVKGISETVAKAIKKEFKTVEKPVVKPEEKKRKPTSEVKKKPGKPEKKKIPPKEEKKKELEEIPEEKEKYTVKKKPQLSDEKKKKLMIRKRIKKRTPTFLREEWFRYKRIPRNWRRPDGITSKMRKNLKYRPSKVRVGFRGPKEARGLHPSGFEEIMVYNVKDLEAIDPATQAARIGGTVGTKKRMEIEKKAKELDVRLLNI